MMLQHSTTLLRNGNSALVPALGVRPSLVRCRPESSERTSFLKDCQRRVFGEVRQGFGGSRQMSSSVHAAGAGEQNIVVEEQAFQKSEGPSLKVSPGQSFPLGVSEVESGINFAIFSQNCTAVTLCLMLQERGMHSKLEEGMLELSLDSQVNKTGDIWHICVEILRHEKEKESAQRSPESALT